jgi:hypothetical protein
VIGAERPDLGQNGMAAMTPTILGLPDVAARALGRLPSDLIVAPGDDAGDEAMHGSSVSATSLRLPALDPARPCRNPVRMGGLRSRRLRRTSYSCYVLTKAPHPCHYSSNGRRVRNRPLAAGIRGRPLVVFCISSVPYDSIWEMSIWERPPGWLARDAKLNSRSDYAVSRVG